MGLEARPFDRFGDPVRGLPDPSGGSFDAAGDFDRLLDTPEDPWFSRIDPYGETAFTTAEMTGLLSSIGRSLALELSGTERRGLLRLETMVYAARAAGGSVKFVGD